MFPIGEVYGSGFGPSCRALQDYAIAQKKPLLFFGGSLTEYAVQSSTNSPQTGWSSLVGQIGATQSNRLPWASDINYGRAVHDSPTTQS